MEYDGNHFKQMQFIIAFRRWISDVKFHIYKI